MGINAHRWSSRSWIAPTTRPQRLRFLVPGDVLIRTMRGEPAGYATPADPAFISFRSLSTSDTGSGYRHHHLRYKSAAAVEGRNHVTGIEDVHAGPSRGDLGDHDLG